MELILKETMESKKHMLSDVRIWQKLMKWSIMEEFGHGLNSSNTGKLKPMEDGSLMIQIIQKILGANFLR